MCEKTIKEYLLNKLIAKNNKSLAKATKLLNKNK
mgnify:CR=1 FL=1